MVDAINKLIKRKYYFLDRYFKIKKFEIGKFRKVNPFETNLIRYDNVTIFYNLLV